MIVIYMLAAVVCGALLSTQPALNAMLGRAIGSPYGAVLVSILVAFLGSLAMATAFGRGDLSRSSLASVPWWAFLGGLIGTVFVLGGILVAPVIGALAFFICLIAGQLLGATLADHLGAFGLEVRPITLQRLAGLALVLAGALIVQRG